MSRQPERSPTRSDVRETYDRIAPHFAATRPEAWPEVRAFLAGREGRVGLDVGVGNGRHAEVLAGACGRVLGVDASTAALGEARSRASERGFPLALAVGDAAALPVRDSVVDLGVYVATLHHLPSTALRVASLDELARVLRSTGRAIVSAWCVTHDRFDAEASFDTTVDWTLPDGTTVGRYYHVYDGEEFRRDLDASALSREETFESAGNWYAVVRPEQ